MAGRKAPALAEKVQELEGGQDGSFMQAARLAVAKKGLAGAELAQGHPTMSAITGGLAGAATGAMAGPSLISKGQRAGANIRDILR